MNELINLRTTIREVDVSQVAGYKRRIVLTQDVTITGLGFTFLVRILWLKLQLQIICLKNATKFM